MAPKLTPEIYQILKGENKDMTATHLDDEFNKFTTALEQFFLIDARYQPAWIDFVKKPGKTLTLTEWGIIVPPLLYLHLSSIWKKQRFVPILIRDFDPLVVEPRSQKVTQLCGPFNEKGWVNVINIARKTFLDGQSMSFSDTSHILASLAPHIQVLKSTCALLKNQAFNNVVLNVTLAALHLLILRLGLLTFGATWQDFLKQVVQDPQRKTTQEALVEFFEPVSKSHLGPVTKYEKMFFSWEAQAGCLEDNLLSTSLANVITAAHGQGGTNLQETTDPSPPPIPSTTGVIPAGPSPPTIPSTTSVIPDKPETNPEGEEDKENPKNDVISVLTELDKPDDEPTDPDKSNDEPMDLEEPDESDKSSSQSKSGSERDKDWNPEDLISFRSRVKLNHFRQA
ncbi:hypothetical protein GGU10DRAFT_380816 [Lentinula aff. detonsa]|uniref:Uncharacterized protein n=1 Tax=Lentinula aff. detonsa TaxID=2804958 RepID=A0AA38KKJ3_9AGAR|nr:hypothetical protein GGU10DRAFT_380816 [Lentinula aff. detonsa]